MWSLASLISPIPAVWISIYSTFVYTTWIELLLLIRAKKFNRANWKLLPKFWTNLSVQYSIKRGSFYASTCWSSCLFFTVVDIEKEWKNRREICTEGRHSNRKKQTVRKKAKRVYWKSMWKETPQAEVDLHKELGQPVGAQLHQSWGSVLSQLHQSWGSSLPQLHQRTKIWLIMQLAPKLKYDAFEHIGISCNWLPLQLYCN